MINSKLRSKLIRKLKSSGAPMPYTGARMNCERSGQTTYELLKCDGSYIYVNREVFLAWQEVLWPERAGQF